MSHKTGLNNILDSKAMTSLSTSNKLNSLKSNIIKTAGLYLTHWRTNSEPILPPAPVMSTLFPFIKFLMEFSSSLTSSLNKLDIKYKTKREFTNNANENCKEIQFYDFKLNDINIDEAIFCEDKLIKLKFYKGDLKPI